MTISKSPKFVYVNIWHKTNILVSLRKPTNKKNHPNKTKWCTAAIIKDGQAHILSIIEIVINIICLHLTAF